MDAEDYIQTGLKRLRFDDEHSAKRQRHEHDEECMDIDAYEPTQSFEPVVYQRQDYRVQDLQVHHPIDNLSDIPPRFEWKPYFPLYKSVEPKLDPSNGQLVLYRPIL